MCNSLVIYYSKYGSTKQYSEWIAEDINANIIRLEDVDSNQLSYYDTIIIGSGVYAGGLKIKKFITKNKSILDNKNVIIFAVGASPATLEQRDKIFNDTFKKKLSGNYNFYLLRGAFDYEKLNFDDKMLITVFLQTLKSDKKLDEQSEAIIECKKNPADWTCKENLTCIYDILKY